MYVYFDIKNAQCWYTERFKSIIIVLQGQRFQKKRLLLSGYWLFFFDLLSMYLTRYVVATEPIIVATIVNVRISIEPPPYIVIVMIDNWVVLIIDYPHIDLLILCYIGRRLSMNIGDYFE
jgi:hypothetical protein